MEHTVWGKWGENYLVSINGDVITLGQRSGVIKPLLTEWGYYRFAEYARSTGKSRYIRVNRAVAILFIPNKDNLPEANHLDGVKINNRVENLEWASKSRNIKHSWDNGSRPRKVGSKPTLHALSDEDKLEVARLRDVEGLSYLKIAALLGSNSTTVRNIYLRVFNYGL